jgi:spore maturation protein CgeB
LIFVLILCYRWIIGCIFIFYCLKICWFHEEWTYFLEHSSNSRENNYKFKELFTNWNECLPFVSSLIGCRP